MNIESTKLLAFLRSAVVSESAFSHQQSVVAPNALFSKERLYKLLHNPLIGPDWLQVAVSGKAIDYQAQFLWKSVQGKQLKFFDKRPLMQALKNKASLVLEGLDILDHEIAELITEVDQVFPCVLSHCEAFWSRGGAGGNEAYGGHRDRDDVLVIQIEGQKRWRIYEKQQRRFVGNSPLSEVDLGPLAAELVMSPGDALYVRAGTPHWCTTPGDHSLHLSIDLNDQTPNVDQISQAANNRYFRGTAPAHSSPREVIEAYAQILKSSDLEAEMEKARDTFRQQAKQFRAAILGAHPKDSPW